MPWLARLRAGEHAPIGRGLGRFWQMGAGLLVLVLVGACTSRAEGPMIDLRAPPSATPAPSLQQEQKERLVFAVAAVNSPLYTLDAYAELARYLAERLGLEPKLLTGKTYSEINALLRSGEASIAIVCTGAYVYGNAEFGLELLAAPVIHGQPVYYSYLIVHKDSPITDWQDLRGRTFAFTDPLSNSGRLVPLYRIWQMGLTPETLFSKYIFTYSHDNSIRAVANRLVDAAAVDSLVYDFALSEGKDDASKTKIIWRSPPYPINPVVASPLLDPTLKLRLRTLLLDMDSTEEGRAVLARLRFDRFVPISNDAYAPVRTMVQALGKQVAW